MTLGALAVLLLAYGTSWQRFASVWGDNRSYGLLAAGLCCWRLWQMRREFVPERAEVDLLLTMLGAALSVGWLAATVVNVQVLHLAVLPFILLAWTGAVFGRGALLLARSVALVFLLAVPLWEILNGPLQWMTAFVNGVLVRAVSLRAVVDGNHIRFPFGTIEVAESCSGLSYFMTALTISTVYGQTLLRHPRARLIAMASAVSLAIVGNWLRVFGLVLIGSSTRMQSPLMNEHATYGWAIFCVTLVVFFVITRRIERFDDALMTGYPLAERSRREGTLRTADLAAPGRMAFILQRVAFATAASLIGPLVYFSFRMVPTEPASEGRPAGLVADALWIPASPDANRGGALPWAPLYEGATQRVSLWFERGAGRVQVDRYLYAEQSQNAELISSQNRIATVSNTLAERTVGPLDGDLRTVREATVRTTDGVRLVWFWYRVADMETSNPVKAKLLELVTFVTRGPPSELIAVSTPCGPNDCRAASETLFLLVTGRPMPAR